MTGAWLGAAPLLLASESATRRGLLERAGLPVETEPAGVDERALEGGFGDVRPDDVARRLADAKALAVSARHPGRWVVGADQVLVCEGRRFDKATDRDDAHRTLARLAGRTHRLVSAATIARGGSVAASFAESADLTMRPLDDAAIARYLDAAGPAATRSVGAYEIEGIGIQLFARIEGEHSTILGLPMLPLLAALRRLGALAP